MKTPRDLPRTCQRGHLVAGENASVRPSGEVQCQECRKLANRRHQMRKKGHPTPKVSMRFRERLAALEAEYGRGRCWPWPGQQKSRYKTTSVTRNGRVVKGLLVHRAAYKILRGPIPDGLVLDHICQNPECSNPWHLEPVTSRENNSRSNSPSSINARKLQCDYGHPFSYENTRFYKNSRICLTCERQRRKGEPRGEGLRLQRRILGL